MPETVNVDEIIDRRQVSVLQWRVVLLGALTLMLDGFDSQMIAYVAPALKTAWRLDAGALGPVFSAGVLGVGLGSLLIGPFGDRFGRARTLLIVVMLFALLSFLHAQTTTIPQLLVMRFCIGLALGSVIPLVIVLCNEYAPLRHRAKMVTMMTCGYGLGAASGGYIAIHIVPAFGWTSIFYLGAVLPLFLAGAIFLWMPESIRFLALRNETGRIRAVLRKIDPSLPDAPGTRFIMASSDEAATGSRLMTKVGELFSERRATVTLLLWTCLFMNLIVLNFFNNWLPTLVISIGVPERQALQAATALQFGGVVGIASIGVLVDRFGYYRVLAAVFASGSAVIAAISLADASVSILIAAIFAAGFAVVGSQMTLGALSATLYPTHIRATGSSWAFGVARLLSFIGPLLGGVMIARHWPIQTIFFCAAVPMVFAMVAMLAMLRVKQRAGAHEQAVLQADGALT